MVATKMYGIHETPNFKWPQSEIYQQNDEIAPTILQESVTENITNNVVNTVKNLINTFMQNQTEVPILTTTKMNIEETMDANNTVMGFDGSSINEIFDNNSTLMTFNNTGVIDMINSNNTITNLNTTITEMADSATTASMTEESTNLTNFINDNISTSTISENVFNTFAETVTSTMFAETTTESDLYESEHSGKFAEEKTLYIVIGVILGALLLLIIILLIIYKRYKAKSGIRSRVYCVTDLNEVSISSCERKEDPLNQRISNFT